MNYELAKQLKDAGFPQGDGHYIDEVGASSSYQHRASPHILRGDAFCPTLEELIKACGEDFAVLARIKSVGEPLQYVAHDWSTNSPCIDTDCCPDATVGSTPTEAVAKLWLALHAL